MNDTPTGSGNSDSGVGVPDGKADQFTMRVRQLVGEESVRNFARRAGVGTSTMQNILDGARPTVDKLVAIARAGGVTVDWLATGEGPRSLGEVHGAHALHEAASVYEKQVGDLDELLMWDAIIEVEDVLDLEGVEANGLQKAQLITEVYKRWMATRAGGKRFTSADIIRLVREKVKGGG